MPNVAAHGDDLGYIFEARHINGTLLNDPEDLTADDVKVREVFTQMIADFARHGKVHVGDEELPSFSSAANNFLQISANPKVGNNFRFCEMALWAGLAQRLQDPLCQFLGAIKNVPGSIINATKLDTITGGIGKSMKSSGLLNTNPLARNKGRNRMGIL